MLSCIRLKNPKYTILLLLCIFSLNKNLVSTCALLHHVYDKMYSTKGPNKTKCFRITVSNDISDLFAD